MILNHLSERWPHKRSRSPMFQLLVEVANDRVPARFYNLLYTKRTWWAFNKKSFLQILHCFTYLLSHQFGTCFIIDWEFHDPNWLLSYVSEGVVSQPPTRYPLVIKQRWTISDKWRFYSENQWFLWSMASSQPCLMTPEGIYVHIYIYISIDWFKRKKSGNSHILWENLWFPVDFPWSQPIDSWMGCPTYSSWLTADNSMRGAIEVLQCLSGMQRNRWSAAAWNVRAKGAAELTAFLGDFHRIFDIQKEISLQ